MTHLERAMIRQRPRTRRLLTASIAVPVAVLGLAACRSSDEGGGGGGGGGGDTIKIFLSYPGDNPNSPYDDMPAAAEAAVKAINDDGGINGADLELITCNNLFDQPKSLECARQAVQENVVALVGQSDFYSEQTLPVLEQAGIPTVGLYSFGNPGDFQAANSYPINGGSIQTFLALPRLMADRGVESFSTQACEFPSCQSIVELLEELAPNEGLEFLGNVEVPLTGVTDFSPYISQTQALGATEDVVQVESAATSAGLIRAAEAVGFSPRYYDNSQAIGETVVQEDPETFEGYYIPGPYPSPRDTEDEASVQYAQEQADAAGTTPEEWLSSQVFGQGWSNSFGAWASVHAFAMAAADVEGDVTAESFRAVLDDPSTSYELPGGLATWTPGVEGPPGYPRNSTMREYSIIIQDGQLAPDPETEPFDVVPLVEEYYG
jgi:ABC-type branched-subunit amino acid transport system substrate-binding protein